MLSVVSGTVVDVTDWDLDAQEILVWLEDKSERRAVSYVSLSGPVAVGDYVLLNTTATALSLGTGGYDFVIAKMPAEDGIVDHSPGHIMKARYLPCQKSVLTLEEQPEFADVWEGDLDGVNVLVGQLHSQIIPAACGLALRGKKNVAYIMTDAAALPIVFSHTVRQAKAAGLITATFTCGQAFGGDYETVTLHSALLAAKYIIDADAVIVCQGPGNAGTGTRYGFSGIEQAGILDITAKLGGTPIAIVRMSGADKRERHIGISHHTLTTLSLAYAKCVVPVPMGTDISELDARHDIRFVDNAKTVIKHMKSLGLNVKTMGRTMTDDPLFFAAAGAAGLVG